MKFQEKLILTKQKNESLKNKEHLKFNKNRRHDFS